VNVSSASGPNFLAGLTDRDPLKALLGQPWTIPGGMGQVDDMARAMVSDSSNNNNNSNEIYGSSKALLNAYTYLHAKVEPDLVINSVTPGFIKTDLTKGVGATNLPSQGAVPPCWLMMMMDVAVHPTGRYYGSDCVRSPLSSYRGPGEPPYESHDDLVELPASASQMATVL
jgi:NAD(P)-dependent dehydrogenase (short-subunit alcohol dehydrogenase family)